MSTDDTEPVPFSHGYSLRPIDIDDPSFVVHPRSRYSVSPAAPLAGRSEHWVVTSVVGVTTENETGTTIGLASDPHPAVRTRANKTMEARMRPL